MKLFPTCLDPKVVHTKKGDMLVPCGRCAGCLQMKVEKTTLLLDLESENTKYVEFLTLTYATEYVPYIDFTNNCLRGTALFGVFPIQTAKPRYVQRYNPRSHSYYRSYSNSSLLGTAHFEADFIGDLRDYIDRVNKYYARNPYKNRPHTDSPYKVPVLHYEDILRYHDRLKQFIFKRYGAKIRYYSVGEYGSQSLYPHWHILLFHNSSELHRDFQDVVDLHGHTEENPRQCCRKLYLSKIWTFGDTTTKSTDGKMSSYLSGYLNQHSMFPRLLKKFPQRAFHSILLGVYGLREFSETLFKSEKWRSLTETVVTSKSGVQHDVSIPSSLYARFAYNFTGSSSYSVSDRFALVSQTKHFLDKTDINIYLDEEVYGSLLFLEKSPVAPPALRSYVREVSRPLYNHVNSVNSLKSLYYASIKLYKIADKLGVHPLTYMNKFERFSKYLEYCRLVELYKKLEADDNAAYQYYSCFTSYSTCMDVDIMKTKPIYRAQYADAMASWDSNVKHRAVIDSYKN